MGALCHYWIKKVPVLSAIFCHEKMLDYAYNCQLWKENTDVFITAKILSVGAPELILQAKPRCNLKQEMSRIFLFSIVSLYGCESATN